MTTAVLVGNLVADAETKYTSGGYPVLEFRFAVNEPKRQDGTQVPPTYWRTSLFREDAETYAEHLRKGVRVVVVGRPRVREYERADGTKGTSAEVLYPVVGIVPPRLGTPAPQTTDPWTADAGGYDGAPF